MRLSLFFYCLGALQLFALDGSSQSTRIDLKAENKTLGEVLVLISETAEYSIFFKDDLVGNNRLYNLDYNHEEIGIILSSLLNGTDLGYCITDKLIVIAPRSSETKEKYVEMQQQKVKVQGVVSDLSGGMYMPGVTVAEKNTTNGALTDINGRFELTVAPGAVLLFSHIGYKTLEIPAVEGIMRIRLEEDLQVIDEVVVVAYGETSQKTYTGSVATVKSDAISMNASASATDALQGLAPGVQILHNSSAPGAEPIVRIRGISSVNFSSSPLIVVDGMPYTGGINTINPSDIESISILKDATANSLYGSRAASGVLMITTKKGTGKQGTINFRHTTSITDFAVAPNKKLDPEKMTELVWEMFYNGELDRGMSDVEARQSASEKVRSYFFYGNNTPWIDNGGNYLLEPVTTDGKMIEGAKLVYENNWEETFFERGLRQEYGLDFSGTANEGKLDYFISGSYLKEKGIFHQEYFDRLGGRVNLNSNITDWLKIGTRTSFSHSFIDSPTATMRYYNSMPSVFPIYTFNFEEREYYLDEFGNKVPDTGSLNETGLLWRTGWQQNHLTSGSYENKIGKSFSGSFVDNLNSINTVSLIILPWLNFSSSAGINYRFTENHTYNSGRNGMVRNISSASRQMNKNVSVTLNNILNAKRQFKNHDVRLLVGQEYHQLKINNLSGNRRNFPFLNLFELSAAAEIINAGSYENNYCLISYFSRFEYSYNDKYYLSGGYRTDGSSRFSEENRWGNFWSVGGGWRISDEVFFANIPWIDDLKLKASYGTVGNDQVGTYYAYQGLYNLSHEFDAPAAFISKPEAIGLIWESSVQRNIGLEFGIFNRFNGSIEYYIKDARNLLFNVQQPLSTGITSELRNVGNNENKGMEFTLNGTIISNEKFSWDFDLNATTLKNIVTKTPDGNDLLSGINIVRQGESLYSLYLVEWAGVNPENGNSRWYKNVFQVDELGQTVLDANGKPVVIDRELTENASEVSGVDHMAIYGKGLPDFFGSISTGIKGNGFDFSIMFYYSMGSHMLDASMSELTKYSFDGYAFYEEAMGRWTPEHTQTNIARLSDYNHQQRYIAQSTQWLFRNDFLRLRNLVLGYTIPQEYSKKLAMKSLRIYFNGSNLLTFGEAVRRGRDPEIGFSGRFYDGPDDSSSPTSTLKTFSFGLQATFN